MAISWLVQVQAAPQGDLPYYQGFSAPAVQVHDRSCGSCPSDSALYRNAFVFPRGLFQSLLLQHL